MIEGEGMQTVWRKIKMWGSAVIRATGIPTKVTEQWHVEKEDEGQTLNEAEPLQKEREQSEQKMGAAGRQRVVRVPCCSANAPTCSDLSVVRVGW